MRQKRGLDADKKRPPLGGGSREAGGREPAIEWVVNGFVSPLVSFADTAYAVRPLCRFATSPRIVGSHPRRGSL